MGFKKFIDFYNNFKKCIILFKESEIKHLNIRNFPILLNLCETAALQSFEDSLHS